MVRLKSVCRASMFIKGLMMPTHCIVDAEKDADMKSLSPKEAITILEGMRIDIPVPKAAATQRKRNVALDMAISALSCSEIPNSSDSISRQDAVNALDRIFDNVPMELTTEILRLRRELRGLPAADVVPVVHAYWRDTGSGQECSACKEIQYGYDTGRHYCANCGAKMDAQGEE